MFDLAMVGIGLVLIFAGASVWHVMAWWDRRRPVQLTWIAPTTPVRTPATVRVVRRPFDWERD